MVEILVWGLVIGIVHFVIVGGLYQNPFVARLYAAAERHPGVKPWPDKKTYILLMFLGTQLEVFILTGAYLYLRQFFAGPYDMMTAVVLAGLFASIRVYPRFWNMWIQSTYPNRLLAVELANGTIGTFVIVIGLKLLRS